MVITIVRQVIFWMALPILAALGVLLLRGKTHREFPCFFCYVWLVELVGITRLVTLRFVGGAYVYIFWISDVLIAVMTFFVAYELFVRRLFPRFYAVRFYRYLFPVTSCVIVLIAVPAALENRKVSLILTCIHGLEILRVTVLLFFVGLMTFMGRHWMRGEFGIALGLGLQAAASLITSARWTKSLLPSSLFLWLPVVAFDIACLVWLITFLKPETRADVVKATVDPRVVQDLQQWEKTLKRSWTGKKPS